MYGETGTQDAVCWPGLAWRADGFPGLPGVIDEGETDLPSSACPDCGLL